MSYSPTLSIERPLRPLRRAFSAPLFAALLVLGSAAASAQASPNVYINEINYDTPGDDDITSTTRIEFVEIVAPAGFDTAGFALVVYDGADGTVVERRDFPENSPRDTVFPDQGDGFGFLALRISQPDGIGGLALVDAQENVIQFLSYEGTFTATEGAADGLTSTEVPVTDSDQALGEDDVSLQLIGTGKMYADFRWASGSKVTPNKINTGQAIGDAVSVEDGAAAGSSLAIYPNPSAGRVSVDLTVASPDYARVAVYDALGREVAVLHDGPVSGETRATVDADALVPGVYVVRAVTSGFALTQRLSVVR